MTIKERRKINSSKDKSRIAKELGILCLSSKEDRKLIQNSLRGELVKYFEEKGLHTEKKDWKIRIRPEHKKYLLIGIDTSENDGESLSCALIKTYAMSPSGEDLINAWALNGKSMIETMKDDKRKIFKECEAKGKISFKEVLNDLELCLARTNDKNQTFEEEEEESIDKEL